MIIILSSNDLPWYRTATPQSCCSNLGSLIKARIVIGINSNEYYGLAINQQPRRKEKDNLVSRPQFEVSARDLGKTSWTGTETDGQCECAAHRT